MRRATISRFYSIHFLVPFLIAALSVFHLFYIHVRGSRNPVGEYSQSLKVYFWPYFGVKDLLGLGVILVLFLVVVFFLSDVFRDPDNFIAANSIVTPAHIKPEWYFLFAYAILRCIPNKLLGVLGLVFSLLVLYILPFSSNKVLNGSWLYGFFFWVWVFNFVLLTWLGGCPVESTYTYLSQICSFLYFFYFLVVCL